MKVFEIIVEAKEKQLSKSLKNAAPHARQYDDIDQYYGMYRFGIAMAKSPDDPGYSEGPAKDIPAVWMYTSADEEIVNRAEKNQGIKGKTIVQKGPSQENNTVNTVSPVATPKRNKYGV
jgi:hypothetical protein